MGLFRNPRPVVYGLVVFTVLAITAFATQCRADPVFVVEAGATLFRGPAEVLALNVHWPEAGPKDADLSMGLTLIGSSKYRGLDQPNQAAIQFQMVDGFGYLDIGVGVVFIQNTDAYNSSPANFFLMLGYRFSKHFGLVIRHWSNAGTVEGNLGRDMLLVGWRF